MDVKGISWVENICQRFEAICEEVDEFICEDAVKYVGDQMRTVQENVKKMYSEVKQDLLDSSSLNPLKEVKEDETTVNTEKPKYSSENLSVNAVSKEAMKESAGSEKGENYDFCYSVKDQCTSKNSSDKFTELVSSTSSTSDVYSWGDFDQDKSASDMSSLNSFAEKGLGEEFHLEVYSGRVDYSFEYLDGSVKEESNVEGANSRKKVQRIFGSVAEGNVDQTAAISHEDGSVELNETLVKATVDTFGKGDMQNAVEVMNELSVTTTESLNPSLDLVIKAGDADLGVLLNEQLSKLKLEESCILVEKNDCSKSILEESPKSYKKKIRDVFSMRKWSKMKKDQEQLAGWYEDRRGKNMVPCSAMQAEFLSTQSSVSFESDWELL